MKIKKIDIIKAYHNGIVIYFIGIRDNKEEIYTYKTIYGKNKKEIIKNALEWAIKENQ